MAGGFARGDTNGTDFDALLGAGDDYHIGGFSIGSVGSLRYGRVGGSMALRKKARSARYESTHKAKTHSSPRRVRKRPIPPGSATSLLFPSSALSGSTNFAPALPASMPASTRQIFLPCKVRTLVAMARSWMSASQRSSHRWSASSPLTPENWAAKLQRAEYHCRRLFKLLICE